MLIAQISDMHVKAPGERLYGRIDTPGYLERAVAHIEALDPKPDVVLATGDLVEAGEPEEYAHVKRLLAPLSMPIYLIPGNHDARDALRDVFADHDYLPRSGFLHYTIETFPLRLIALDSLVPGAARSAPSGSTGCRHGSPKTIGRPSCLCIIRRSTAASQPPTASG